MCVYEFVVCGCACMGAYGVCIFVSLCVHVFVCLCKFVCVAVGTCLNMCVFCEFV